MRKIDNVSSLARLEALRLHSLVDLPDLPTSILGARSQAKKLLQEMNDKIPQKWQNIQLILRFSNYQHLVVEKL